MKKINIITTYTDGVKTTKIFNEHESFEVASFIGKLMGDIFYGIRDSAIDKIEITKIK